MANKNVSFSPKAVPKTMACHLGWCHVDLMIIGSHLIREATASPVLTKWWNWELMLATNIGSPWPEVTNFGRQNFGSQICFCTKLVILMVAKMFKHFFVQGMSTVEEHHMWCHNRMTLIVSNGLLAYRQNQGFRKTASNYVHTRFPRSVTLGAVNGIYETRKVMLNQYSF